MYKLFFWGWRYSYNHPKLPAKFANQDRRVKHGRWKWRSWADFGDECYRYTGNAVKFKAAAYW